MTFPFWACAAITIVSASVSFSYAIAGLRGSNDAAQTASMYALARSSALLTVSIIAPFTRSVGFVAAIATAMVIVQLADTLVGVRISDRIKTIGPCVTAIVNLGALAFMLAR